MSESTQQTPSSAAASALPGAVPASAALNKQELNSLMQRARERAAVRGGAEAAARERAWRRLLDEVSNHSELFFAMAAATRTLQPSEAASTPRILISVSLDSPDDVLHRAQRHFSAESLEALEAALREQQQSCEAADAADAAEASSADATAALARNGETARLRALVDAVRAYEPAREFVLAAHFHPTAAVLRPASFVAAVARDAERRFWMCEACGAKFDTSDDVDVDSADSADKNNGDNDSKTPQRRAVRDGRCVCERCCMARYCSASCRAARAAAHAYSCTPPDADAGWMPYEDTGAAAAAASTATAAAAPSQ